MVSSRERSFIDQAVCYHASGGDIDAPVQIGLEESERVRIREIRRAHQGATRLWFAACHNWCSAIEWLLQHGANRSGHAQDFTPLHIASSYDHCDATVLLLDAGARVDDRNANAQTALHFAHGHPKMCKLLLSRGASLDARDTYGRDPEAHARFRGNTATVDLLAAVRAAGGWLPYVNAPRKELLALRQRLPALRDRGRAAPSSSVRAHERLFLETPDDVFTSVLAFWRSDRDYFWRSDRDSDDSEGDRESDDDSDGDFDE